MQLEELTDRLETATTRRTIVKTGVRLAYAAPLVAASFKLSAIGAGAQADTCDDLSPKPLGVGGLLLTCKADASGFGCDVREDVDDDGEDPPKGSAQVEVDAISGRVVCVCNNQSGCRIDQPDGSVAVYARAEIVDACQPVPLPDFCFSTISV